MNLMNALGALGSPGMGIPGLNSHVMGLADRLMAAGQPHVLGQGTSLMSALQPQKSTNPMEMMSLMAALMHAKKLNGQFAQAALPQMGVNGIMPPGL